MILQQTDKIERVKCDYCGCVYCWDIYAERFIEGDGDDWHDIPAFWRYHIFGDLHPNYRRHLTGEFCKECAKQLTPWIYRLHDIAHLEWQLAKLRRTINEHKNKHH